MADTIVSPTTTREAVLAAGKQMLAEGLVEGTSGNISGRLPDGLVCLTPSSVRSMLTSFPATSSS